MLSFGSTLCKNICTNCRNSSKSIVITGQTEVYKQHRWAALDYHQQMCHQNQSKLQHHLSSSFSSSSSPSFSPTRLHTTLYDHLNNFPAILLTLRNSPEPSWVVIILATRSQSDCQTDERDREAERQTGKESDRQTGGQMDSATAKGQGEGQRKSS